MRYSIVSAVYNSEKYLNDFFNSIIKQTLSFEENIYLILVDDGSTDNSAKIIKQWQKRYKNIVYIYQENKGQAAARNNGLDYVKTTWVTFIDPDDFINKKYFKEADNIVKKNNDLVFVCCKLIYYFEHLKLRIDYHPLRKSFVRNNNLILIKNMDNRIHLSSSSAFFKMELVNKMGLRFDTRVKPNFEDAHFIGRYLLEYQEKYVAFLPKCKYFYRKRWHKTSTVDTSWNKKAKYRDLLIYGHINLLKKKKNTPKFIQVMVLYDLIWHFKKHINKNEINSLLNKGEIEEYENLLLEIFKYIDIATILDFNLANCTFMYKVALINRFKNSDIPYQIIYVDSIKREKVILYYYSSEALEFECKVDKQTIPYLELKEGKSYFLNKKFIKKFFIEINLPKNYRDIEIKLDNLQTYINKEYNIINKRNLKKNNSETFKKLIKDIMRKYL